MAPFQLFYLLVSLGVFTLAWLRGGHTERAAVVLMILAYLVSFAVQEVTLNQFRIGDASVDLVVLVVFVWLAMRRDRWWTLAASAVCGLTMVAHIAIFLTPDLQEQHIRMDVAGRWGLGVFLVLCIGGGVVERWMAGEEAVSGLAQWSKRSRGAP
jgi:peptidoglycan/LPS O-acetylase OafA/YrhL